MEIRDGSFWTEFLDVCYCYTDIFYFLETMSIPYLRWKNEGAYAGGNFLTKSSYKLRSKNIVSKITGCVMISVSVYRYLINII